MENSFIHLGTNARHSVPEHRDECECTVPALKGVFGLVKERNINVKVPQINIQLQAVLSARQEAPTVLQGM